MQFKVVNLPFFFFLFLVSFNQLGACFFVCSSCSYHQKYLLQKHPTLISALGIKTNAQLIASSPAARLNGYVGGYGSSANLEKEWSSFGISNDDLKFKVLRLCKDGTSATCGRR